MTPAKQVKKQINARALNFLRRFGCMWKSYRILSWLIELTQVRSQQPCSEIDVVFKYNQKVLIAGRAIKREKLSLFKLLNLTKKISVEYLPL